MASLASLVSGSLLLSLSEKVKLGYIYWGLAAVNLLCIVFFSFTIADVIRDKKFRGLKSVSDSAIAELNEEEEDWRDKSGMVRIKAVLKQTWIEL